MNNVLLRLCRVVEGVEDPHDAGRIKVDINGIDSYETTVENLKWCFPLLPKLLHVRPKPGETVLVIFETIDSEKDNRYYIGPVLSQPYFYNLETFSTTSLNGLDDARSDMVENPKNNKEYKLTFPTDEDIALIGRKNAEIILRENEVRMLCGQQESPDNEKYIQRMNFSSNPAYIQMKYFQKGMSPKIKNGPMSGQNSSQINSVVNIGADKINFVNEKNAHKMLGYDSDTGNVSEENIYNEIKHIIEDGHQLVYGDLLIEYLKKFINLFRIHTHPFPGTPPALSETNSAIVNENLDRMLVEYIHLS